MLKNKLAGNIISLFTLKGAEYIISFITLPYLCVYWGLRNTVP